MKTNNKKITFFFSSLRAGGGERVMVALTNAFVEDGYNVDTIVLKRVGEYSDHFKKEVRVIDFAVWRMIFSLPKLVWYLRKENPHAIIATDEYTHILILLAKWVTFSRVRVILRIGNMYSQLYGRYSGMKRAFTFFIIKRIYRFADEVVANSEGVAEDIKRLTQINSDKVSIIYNPKDSKVINSQAEQKTGEEWLDNKTVPVVVAAGRLREQKNFSLLIRSFATVQKKVSTRLVIVGAGRDKSVLEDVIIEYELGDRVRLVGYQENPYAFMKKADVYVHTSLWEGMPNVLMEAMACGLPVISTDCPSGPRELLAPETNPTQHMLEGVEEAQYGVLVPIKDEKSLSEALELMISNPELREHYHYQSLMRAKDFGTKKIIQKYKRVLFS